MATLSEAKDQEREFVGFALSSLQPVISLSACKVPGQVDLTIHPPIPRPWSAGTNLEKHSSYNKTACDIRVVFPAQAVANPQPRV
jgi:hypothetical protein